MLGFTTLSNGLIAYYSQIGLRDSEMLVVLQLEAFSQHGENFPSSEKIAANTNLSTIEVNALIQRLIEKKFLAIKSRHDNNNKIANYYSLAGLYNELDHFIKEEVMGKGQAQNDVETVKQGLANDPLNSLFREFEIEFGRFLSPIEKEEIVSWLKDDHYSTDMVKLALREAVLSQAYSIKYIDRVLLNWQRHNLKTSTEIKQFLQRNR